MKINLGCGSLLLPGYINCDLYNPAAEMKCDVKDLPFPDDSVDEIYASHIIEHFDFFEGKDKVLPEWRRVLKVGGILIIETPDLAASCKEFSRLYEAGEQQQCINLYSHFFSTPWENVGQVHRFLYTPIQMCWTLESLYFKNIRQERALRYCDRESVCMKFIAEK
jgi:predicted SAM-dependent methyltransferase